MSASDQESHGCVECYSINTGFHILKNQIKKCNECGGTVLFLQELLDYIAELKSEIRTYQEIYE